MTASHDLRFKSLLKLARVRRDFFELFLPEAAKYIDFSLLETAGEGRGTLHARKRAGDLVFRTRFRGTEAAFVIHLEHEARKDDLLVQRMLEYFALDWREFRVPVYPVLVLSGPASAKGLSLPVRVEFPDRRVLEFDFPVIDLPRMNSRNYVKQPNLAGLALAARMRVDQGMRYDLVRDFALTVTSAPAKDEERKEVVDFFSSYQELETEEALKLADELGRVQPEELRERIMASTNPWVKVGIHKGIAQGIEKGIAQGREQGRQEGLKEGEAELVLRLLARRFGRVTPNQRAAIRKLDLERLGALGEALLDFRSAADLTSWLRKN